MSRQLTTVRQNKIKTFIVMAWNAPVDLKSLVRDYPGFPKEGIIFRDFGPALAEPAALRFIAEEFGRQFDMDEIDVVAGIESRGFILSALLGSAYGKGMVMIRKPGKLPGGTSRRSYQLEYGEGELEIQDGSVPDGARVLVCDDLLATGGTARAAGRLVEDVGGKVAGFAFVIELVGLDGSRAISDYNYRSLIQY